MKNTTVIHNETDKKAFIEKMEKAEIIKPILVETSLYKKKRSLAINRLLWLWNNTIQKHIRETQGEIYSSDDVHEFFVSLLLPRQVVEINGKERTIRAHTSNFTNKEMVEYLELLEHYCGEHLHLALPHPDEIYNEAMRA